VLGCGSPPGELHPAVAPGCGARPARGVRAGPIASAFRAMAPKGDGPEGPVWWCDVAAWVGALGGTGGRRHREELSCATPSRRRKAGEGTNPSGSTRGRRECTTFPRTVARISPPGRAPTRAGGRHWWWQARRAALRCSPLAGRAELQAGEDPAWRGRPPRTAKRSSRLGRCTRPSGDSGPSIRFKPGAVQTIASGAWPSRLSRIGPNESIHGGGPAAGAYGLQQRRRSVNIRAGVSIFPSPAVF